jgi:hypothetical protein
MPLNHLLQTVLPGPLNFTFSTPIYPIRNVRVVFNPPSETRREAISVSASRNPFHAVALCMNGVVANPDTCKTAEAHCLFFGLFL